MTSKIRQRVAPHTRLLLAVCAVVFLAVCALVPFARAQNADDDGFSLQVSPSPLVATVEPGKTTTLELNIRNTNTKAQNLKMGLKAFSVDPDSGQVTLLNDEPKDVKDFVSFASPNLHLEAGAIFAQKVTIAVPEDAGFTYSFAISIAREEPNKLPDGSSAIQGSVAVFTLLNVNKQGSERKFELSEFAASKHAYQYLPADFNLKLKNTGNTLVQPKGNIFIQRGSNDQKPIAVIPLNDAGGLILPGTSRTLSASWNDGFPHYQTKDDGSKKLVWELSKLSNLRIGKYTAKVVAVYDDGQRDVPITAEVTFWVWPWHLMLGLVVVLILVVVGGYTVARRTAKIVNRKYKNGHKS